MELLSQPDVIETVGMCAVWFVAGVLVRALWGAPPRRSRNISNFTRR